MYLQNMTYLPYEAMVGRLLARVSVRYLVLAARVHAKRLRPALSRPDDGNARRMYRIEIVSSGIVSKTKGVAR